MLSNISISAGNGNNQLFPLLQIKLELKLPSEATSGLLQFRFRSKQCGVPTWSRKKGELLSESDHLNVLKACLKYLYFEKKISMIELEQQVEFGILLPKLFWPIVRKTCSSDLEKLLNFKAEDREFAKFLRSLEQFIQTAVTGQNNFW